MINSIPYPLIVNAESTVTLFYSSFCKFFWSVSCKPFIYLNILLNQKYSAVAFVVTLIRFKIFIYLK